MNTPGRTQHTAAGVALALGVDTGDVITVLGWMEATQVGESDDLPGEIVEELYGVLDGPDCARSVPEAWLGPDVGLSVEWRSLGPDDRDPRVT